jgi:lysine-specific demethylase 8
MPDVETFFTQYAFKRKPVVITDLFAGEPIRQITRLEDAKAAFGDVGLRVRDEYASLAVSSSPAHQTMTFNEYWDFVKANPLTTMVCTEYEIPAKIMMHFKLPGVCNRSDADQEEILSLPRKYGDYDLHANLFLANRHNKAHLHYDGDHRQVLLYQVFGRKLVILFQPESSVKLKPLDGPFFSASGVYLDQMSEDEKFAFIDHADGYYTILNPGEAIYIPMLIWHHLEYIDDAMSFNIRFGRNKYGRFLSDNFHRDLYIQTFASKLGDPSIVISKYEQAIASVIAEYLKPAPSLLDKVKGARKVFKELAAQFCAEARAHEYCPEREEQVLEKIMLDIGETLRYRSPEFIAATRPVGPATSLQKQQLEARAVSCGYSPKVLKHVLYNRIGKQKIDQLTKAEAALFLSYLRSPGASMTEAARSIHA